MSNTDVGYGQQFPFDSNSDFNKVAFAARQIVERISTMKLVQVTAVHVGSGTPPVAGTVDVMPLVNQIDGNGNPTPHGVVPGLPWFRLQSGLGAVICDPQVNDIGYVVCADRDSSGVVSTKKQANPGSRRSYDLADGIYVGGCLMAAPKQYVEFTSDGIQIVDGNGNSIKMASGGVTITDSNGNVLNMTSNGNTLMGNLAVTGTITATQGITAGQGGGDQVGLQTHTHQQGVDSHGDVEQATMAPTAGT